MASFWGSAWNQLQPVHGYERPDNSAPYRVPDEIRNQWGPDDGPPGGHV